jgi:hypothetical protein
MTLDPVTADIRTAIPPPPKDGAGGYPVENLPAGARLTKTGEPAKELAKTDAEFSKEQIAVSRATEPAISRFKAMGQAFRLFETGSLAEKQYAAASIAAAVGANDVARKIMNGEVSGPEWVEKEGVNVVLDTLKAATPRFAQSEFNTLTAKGVPSITKRPETNWNLLSEGLGLATRNERFLQDWEKARQNGWQSPTAFYTAWKEANPIDGFVRSAQRQMGNFRGMNLPPPSDWAAGAVYVAPQRMTPEMRASLAARGVQPGQMFKYNGPDAPKSIETVDPSQYLTVHLGKF